MFCSKCGAENVDGSTFCSSCGASLTTPTQPEVGPATQPQSVKVQVDPSVASPYGSPGTGALWLSIFGFVCGIPAILGIIFGIGARREAKQRGKSPAKANWAIGIGVAWLIPVVVVAGSLMSGGSNTDSVQEQVDDRSTQDAQVLGTEESDSESDDGPDLEALRSTLVDEGFDCDTQPDGVMGLIQCRKGSVKDPTYGETPVQVVNIEMEFGSVSGYAKPKTLELIREYLPVEDMGDDGSGTGSRMFG